MNYEQIVLNKLNRLYQLYNRKYNNAYDKTTILCEAFPQDSPTRKYCDREILIIVMRAIEKGGTVRHNPVTVNFLKKSNELYKHLKN